MADNKITLMMKDQGVRTTLDYGVLDISGDETYGYRPFQLLVSAIAACSGSVFRKILEKQRTEIADMTITAEVERNPEEANRIEKISLEFIVKGYRLDPAKLYKNLELARKNCSMVRSVEDSIKIEERLDIIELS
ncbi:OsmC family protein [Lentibacillus saliphilus]|uniref:OsmC family protein n=1 Tax=Lentibacillus saliphilus TaxID=2737028 RepID=UPI001FECC683|nr:OsmC family protein [Lentibacillus saliphilus]